MGARPAIAIEVGPRQLRAVLAARNGRTLMVEKVLVAEIPADVSVNGSAAPAGTLGAWIADRLRQAHMLRGAATVALARDQVALKRMTLPTTDDGELPEMTRLALRRDLPFDADTAVIDFVPVDRAGAGTTVLAVAAPGEVVGAARRAMKEAGLHTERIALRAAGAAALLRGMKPAPRAAEEAGGAARGATLVLDATNESVEICVVEGGAIRFSRAAPVPEEAQAAGADAVAAAIATETSRTLMSYRVVENAGRVDDVVVMAPPGLAGPVAARIGAALGVAASVLDVHPLVVGGGDDIARVWPLAGLLLEPSLGGAAIDFAHPRRPVDRTSRRRRLAALAAGLVIVLALAALTAARREMSGLRRELASHRADLAAVAPVLGRYQRDTYTLAHLRRLEAVDESWLDHLLALQAITPAPPKAVLDGWTGALEFRGVEFDPKRKAWSAPREITIVIEGEAADRLTADALRDALVQAASYETSSSGSDAAGGRRLPFGFTYRLRGPGGARPADGAPPRATARGAGGAP
jgi:Tfp pilus assembly PilM family ATPase